MDCLKRTYKKKIHQLKKEHDTTTLEKTIRDGTQTLIKNALEYFKLENIKKEMEKTAAIENLQLDKYGQIIDLLAEFSLILPDIKENQEIVQQEIKHQITIYKIDENPFALFLQRIMDNYVITVKKKIKEKTELSMSANMKRCPECTKWVLPNARICKHCGVILGGLSAIPLTSESDWLRKGQTLYRAGNFQEALSLFSNAIDLNPKSKLAYYYRGIIHKKLGNHPRSVNDLTAAAQLGHKNAQELLRSMMINTQEWKAAINEEAKIGG
ncbi:tetratricopeptide repeat protein [Desulfonema magnum]|nr:tetratricopeptide repeat protein [Desulfonema magnum]